MDLPFQIVTGTHANGVEDDSPAINGFLAQARGVVFLPAGTYSVRSSLEVPPGVTLLGAGWTWPGAVQPLPRLRGTWLIAPVNSQFSPIVLRDGSALRNVAFAVDGQHTPAAQPHRFPDINATVHVQGSDALIEDLFMANPYVGVYIDGVGRVTIRRLYGQPLQFGIVIDRSLDTNYIDNVHFWPYWQRMDGPQAQFQQGQGRAIELYRCDNPHLSNIFVSNYDQGLSLRPSPAPPGGANLPPGQPIPHKVHLVNADFDSTTTGIYVGAPGQVGDLTFVQLANVTMQGPSAGPIQQHPGLWVDRAASFARVHASNLRVSNSITNAMQIDGVNVHFSGENVHLQRWGGDTGLMVSDGSSHAFLGASFSAEGPSRPFGGQGRFHFAQTGGSPGS
jgi:Pectate lyase superfamily protein